MSRGIIPRPGEAERETESDHIPAAKPHFDDHPLLTITLIVFGTLGTIGLSAMAAGVMTGGINTAAITRRWWLLIGLMALLAALGYDRSN